MSRSYTRLIWATLCVLFVGVTVFSVVRFNPFVGRVYAEQTAEATAGEVRSSTAANVMSGGLISNTEPNPFFTLTTLYNNIGPEIPGTNGPSIGPGWGQPDYKYAKSFVPTASGTARIVSLWTQCATNDGTNCLGSGNPTLSFQRDNGSGRPNGVTLGTITFNAPVQTGPSPECSIVSGTPALTAGLKYWAILSSPRPIAWNVQAGSSPDPILRSTDAVTWAPDSFFGSQNLSLRIDDEPACVPNAVPLPTPGTLIENMYVKPTTKSFNTITIGSTGAAPLNITGASITGTDAARFSLLRTEPYPVELAQPYTFPTTLGLNGLSILYVTCTGGPTEGIYNAVITVNTNDPDLTSMTWPLSCINDQTPPVVSYNITPDGLRGWFKTKPAPVFISTTDAPPPTGSLVKNITCTLDGNPFVNVSAGAAQANINAEGTHILSCNATDGANNKSGEFPVTVYVDTQPPNIVGTRNPLATSFGWNKTDTNVAFACIDPLPSSLLFANSVVTAPTLVSGETAGTTINNQGSCEDTAGNVSTPSSVLVKIDKTAPVITPNVAPAPNAAGWNKADTTVSFSCADAGLIQSGLDVNTVAGATISANTPFAGTVVTNSGTCTDKAANAATAQSATVKLDKTLPTISITSDPGATTRVRTATFQFTGTDALSGISGFECRLDAASFAACTSPITFNALSIGNHTFDVRSIDVAGNTNTANFAWRIDKYVSSTTLSAVPAASAPLGTQVTLTATVDETPVQADANPTGTVSFIDTSNGNAVICNSVALSGNQAVCQTSSLAKGSHSIRADYSGDADFDPSSSSLLPYSIFAPPTVSKFFVNPNQANSNNTNLNGTARLSIAITNPPGNPASLTGLAIADTFPAGMEVDATPSPTNTCGGTFAPAAGATSFSYSGGGPLTVGNQCVISVMVKATSVGALVNTTGTVSSTEGGAGLSASGTLNVYAPPTIAKAFGASTMSPGGQTTLTLTISNPAGNPGNLTGVTVTDNFPAGLVAGTPPLISTTNCGGLAITDAGGGPFAAGDTGIKANNATVNSGAPCVIVANVTAAAAGTYNNTTGAITSTNGGTGTTSNTATVSTGQPPTVTKSFSPAQIVVGGTSTMTVAFANSNPFSLSGLSISDNFPAGMEVDSAPGSTNTCGGTFSPVAGATSINLTGGSLAASPGQCSITVTVKATTAGVKTNVTGNVSTSEVATGGTGTGVLTVIGPPSLSKAFLGTSTIAGATEAGNTVTITTSSPHGFSAGQQVTISGVLIAGYNGTFTIASIPTGTSFTYTNPAVGLPASGSGTAVSTRQNVPLNSSSTLAFTMTNANTTVGLTGVSFTDVLPAGLSIADGGPTNACGGTYTTTAATGTIAFSGGTLSSSVPNNSCTFGVTVTAAAVGAQVNTTGVVSSNESGPGGTATATLNVFLPPTVVKSFSPTGVAVNGVSTMTIVITDPATDPGALTQLSFTDTFPSGMVIDATPNASNTCGGALTAAAGAGSLSLSGGSIATPGTSCTTSVSVKATTAGQKLNSVTVSSLEGGPSLAATATLNAASAPSFAKSFTPNQIALGATSTLQFAIGNTNAFSLNGIGFADTLPAGVTVATSGPTAVCGGSLTTTAPNIISLSGATLGASGSCNFPVTVTGAQAGTWTNTTGPIGSTESGPGSTASASITVAAPPSLAKSFSPTSIALGSTTTASFTITNPAANTIPLTGIAFTDVLPAGLTLTDASVPNACGAGSLLTVTAATRTISLQNGVVGTSAPRTCTFNVTVGASGAGSYTNSVSSITSAEGGANNGTVTANLTVVAPPAISKAFTPASVPVGGTSVLTITITNPAANTVALTGVGFTDVFPAGLVVASTPNLTNTCGGTASGGTAGANNVGLSGGTIAVSAGTCTVSVSVTPTIAGPFVNTTSAVTSSNGGSGNTASATLKTAEPVLAVSKTHTGTFTQGQTGAWTIQVKNNGLLATDTTSGTTTVSDTLPAGYTLASYTGTNWTCTGSTTITCTNSQSTAGAGGTFSLITLNVNVPANSPVSVSNTAKAFGGGDQVHTSLATAASSTETVAVVQTPATIQIVSGNNQSAVILTDFSVPLAVIVKDAGNVPINGVPVTFTAPSFGPTGFFAGRDTTQTVNTAASGIATSAIVRAGPVAGGPYLVNAAVGLLTVNFSLTNLIGATDHFVVQAPVSAVPGTAFTFTVIALDAGGNVTPGYAGTIHVTSTDALAVLPANTTLLNGAGTLSATLNTVGLQRITVTDTVSSITGTSNNINVIGTGRRKRADFDGDGRSDISVFRPSDGNWYQLNSAIGFTVTHWGSAGDVLVPGDYDGDGKADFAIWRPSNVPGVADFYVLNSNGYTITGFSHGDTTDKPVTGDFDGDGKADFAVFRPSTATWFINSSSSGQAATIQFGAVGDVPFSMDNDGDGKSNIAVYRPSNATWYIARPTGSPAANFDALQYGLPDDVIVPADYDGDGKEDIAVFRPSMGTWFIHRSSDGLDAGVRFGISEDIPVPGDYDGDGKDDIAVYRPSNGTWYLNGTNGGFTAQAFGLSTDIPVPAAYHP